MNLDRLTDRQIIELGVELRKSKGLSGFGRDAARMNKTDKLTYLRNSFSATSLEEAAAKMLKVPMGGDGAPATGGLPTHNDGPGVPVSGGKAWADMAKQKIEEAAPGSAMTAMLAAKVAGASHEEQQWAYTKQKRAENLAAGHDSERRDDTKAFTACARCGHEWHLHAGGNTQPCMGCLGKSNEDEQCPGFVNPEQLEAEQQAQRDFEAAAQSQASPSIPKAEPKAGPSDEEVLEALDKLGAMADPVTTIARHEAAEATQEIEKLVERAVAQQAPQKIEIKLSDLPKFDTTGKHPLMPKVAALCALPKAYRPNVMLVGPAGCGKTTLAGHVAEALARGFSFVSCSAGLTESAFHGRLLPVGENGRFAYVSTPFADTYENGGVQLVDEVDAADANLLVVLNSALANGHLAIEMRAASGLNPVIHKHDDFVLLLAANTFGTGADTQYVGRGQLDAAFLDRVIVLPMDYDTSYEAKLMGASPSKKQKPWTPSAPTDEDSVKDDMLLLHSWVNDVRKHVTAKSVQRVVSTRMFQKATALRAIGCSMSEIKSDLLAGWRKDEIGTLLQATA